MTSSRWTIADLSSYDFQSDEYKDLYARANATVFQSPGWLDHVYGGLVADFRVSPSIITIREQASAQLVAVLPLVRRRYWMFRVAEFADFGVSDYCTVIADPAQLPTLLADKALASDLQRLLARNDLIVARKVPEPSLPALDLIGRAHRTKLDFGAHDTRLFGTFEHWRDASMSASQRRFLDIKRRDLSRKGRIDIAVTETPDGLAEALDRIRAFREHRFRETTMIDILSKDTFARFYRDVSADGPLGRAYTLNVNGAPASIAFGLVSGDTFHLVLTGFDFARYRNYSVGLLVIEDALRDCIARGMARFDFTIGDQSYKRDFGTSATGMWALWRGFTVPGRILAKAMSHSPTAQHWARRLVRRSANP